MFYGSEGFLELDDSVYRVFQGEERKLIKEGRDQTKSETAPHILNFLDAVKSRNYKTLHADIAIGAASADLCHFANISYRVGRRLVWDHEQKNWRGDAEANQLMSRRNRAPFTWPEPL